MAKQLVCALELATAMSSVANSTMNGKAFIIRLEINFGKSFFVFFFVFVGGGGGGQF